jgi:Fe-S cluster assembly iron-binding protein IscA
MNIKIYNSAKIELDKLLNNQENKKYIRIFVRTISFWSDARIHLYIDELHEDDELFEVDGYNIVINNRLASQVNDISISFGGLLSPNEFSVDCDFNEYY